MGHNRRLQVHIGSLCLFLCITLMMLTGCGSSDSGTKVVLTTGLDKNEVFRIETISCSKPEMMVYLTNMQNQYENVYGQEIWDVRVGEQTLEDNVKDNALAKMAQVKTMNLMAAQMGIELTNQEQKLIETIGDKYYESLNNTEIEAMGIRRDTIYSLYREYLIAQKVYQDIIKDIDPEVSDDEARNISVDYILIKTYAMDGTGKRVEYSDNARESAYARIEEAYGRAQAGEDFDSLIAEYSEAEDTHMSLGKRDIDSDYIRTTLFNLANDELSPVLTTDQGYIIAKCISTYDLDETDANKVAIVEEQKEEIFGQEYDAFVVDLTRMLNDTLWDEISFLHNPDITTASFFEVADEYL